MPLTALIFMSFLFRETPPQAFDETLQNQHETHLPELDASKCKKEEYRHILGKSRHNFELPSSSQSGPFRILGPASMMTKDFRPSRTNIIYDENDIIIQIDCF